ncbi:hypothetical protein ACFPGO_07595 [Arcanobacterium canis]|uniref:ABC transporter permease n=1 Tax=Arcanobacterium canis TaxID=999183 RepID=A0ABY8FY06_9ACTO|nr:hypothetical protein [Arcanobacterium canis]WFM83374.1 hypothetical protein P7079_08300 [Arcanobacterium canis]
MFGKFFTQEWHDNKATIYIGTLGVALAFIVISFPLQMLGIGFISSMASGAAVGAGVAAAIATMVLLGLSYWKTMRGPRAYFTFTIPARVGEIFWAKVLFAYLTILVSLLVVIFGVASIVLHYAWKNSLEFWQVVEPMWNALSQFTPWKVVVVILVVALYVFLMVASIAALISITAQEKYHRFGGGAFVGGLIVFYAACQIVSLAGMLLIPGSVSLTTGQLSWDLMLPSFIDAIRTGGNPTVLGLGCIPVLFALMAGIIAAGLRSIRDRLSLV